MCNVLKLTNHRCFLYADVAARTDMSRERRHHWRRLVVTADDFGYSQRRNEGIARCFRSRGGVLTSDDGVVTSSSGVVTRSSLLVNAVDAPSAVAMATEAGIPLGE